MATKPTQQPEIWASQTLYASGPKAGQPTKASSEAGAAVEGHKPGPTEPTTANEFNVFENKMSLLARWSFEGRFDKMADAHVMETDATGLASARAIDLGDPGQPGPSMTLVNSSTDWAARITSTDNDGLRIQGIHSPADAAQLVLVTTNQDNIALQSAVRVVTTDQPSCTGIRVEAAAAGVISGENLMAGLDVANNGGTGVQVRTTNTELPALRVIALGQGATSARFGHGNLEPGADKNLDGIGIDVRGGDADGASLQGAAGVGGIFQGGDFTTTGTPKAAGHGVVALTGQTDVGAPGGSALFAQTTGPRGIAVEASHVSNTATLPVIQASTGDNPANAINAICIGGGDGVSISAQNGAGLRIVMNPDLGGDLQSHIVMETSNQLPGGSLGVGKVWVQQQIGQNDLRTGIGAATPGYIVVSKNAPCYANTVVTSFTLTGSPTNETIAGNFTWDADMRPAEGTKVRITLWAEVQQDSDSTTAALFKVRDKTVGGDPTILSMELNNPDVGIPGLSIRSGTYAQIYTLPAGGARNFDLVWTGVAGAASGLINALVEIEQIPGT